ncbi:MAG: dTMP kinase [Gammaproteobacteria bacterium RIFCSPLOWO2_02_FULL_56_15]|nr:MAG: dTMP kinase [Gammaproteobacteria bacterium RIFCSPLOWO2_02_FULL_56_15]
MKMSRGLFITLEGVEGAGKSTHAAFIGKQIEQSGRTVTLSREPGGTRAGEDIRELLLHARDAGVSAMTELLLIFSARSQHLEEIIRPALAVGEVVICDRFTDATYAYQGGGRGIATDQIRTLEALVQGGLKPDLTILFDMDPAIGLQRAGGRSAADRFESESIDFFHRVRNGYLRIAEQEPDRVKVVDAAQPIAVVQAEIIEILTARGLC